MLDSGARDDYKDCEMWQTTSSVRSFVDYEYVPEVREGSVWYGCELFESSVVYDSSLLFDVTENFPSVNHHHWDLQFLEPDPAVGHHRPPQFRSLGVFDLWPPCLVHLVNYPTQF